MQLQLQLRKLYSFTFRHPVYVASLLFVAALPFFIGKIFISDHAYLFGRYINYLHIRITLQALLSLAVLGTWLRNIQFHKTNLLLFVAAVTLFLVVSTYTTATFSIATGHEPFIYIFAGIFHVITAAVTIVAGIIAIKTVVLFPNKKLLHITLTIVTLIQLVLGIAQMILAAPIFPTLFTKLGQPPEFTSFTYIGTSIFSRAYGTTPHPNILAGILVLFAFLLLATALSEKTYLLLIPIFCTLLMTFSRGGIFAFLLLLLVYVCRKRFPATKVSFFLLFIGIETIVLISLPTLNALFPTESFIASRAQIELLYLALLQHMPSLTIIGTGFTMSIPALFGSLRDLSVSAIYGNQLLAEPPHNILLLLVVEAGIPTALFLIYSFFSFVGNIFAELPLWQKYALFLMLCILGGVDHFLIY